MTKKDKSKKKKTKRKKVKEIKNEVLEAKIEAWNIHLEAVTENLKYSEKRMDLLIISISSGGLYVIFETLREIKNSDISIANTNILFWSGAILLFTIIINFLSQLTAFKANKAEAQFAQMHLSTLNGEELTKEEICVMDNAEKITTKYQKGTEVLNVSSMVLLFVGLILLAVFYYAIF